MKPVYAQEVLDSDWQVTQAPADGVNTTLAIAGKAGQRDFAKTLVVASISVHTVLLKTQFQQPR